MKKLEKLKLHKLEEICAEEQKSMKGGEESHGYFGDYVAPSTGGTNTGTYNGTDYVSFSSTNGCSGGAGSSTPTYYTPPPVVYPPSPDIWNYPTSSQGGCYTGSNG